VQGNKKAGIYFQKEISPCKLVFLSAIWKEESLELQEKKNQKHEGSKAKKDGR
jgi:hypothetical protein